jgi:hypothetical protein
MVLLLADDMLRARALRYAGKELITATSSSSNKASVYKQKYELNRIG